MSRRARWIYRDMLDCYYDTERPLPKEMDILMDMLGAEGDEDRNIIERHLRFKFVESEDGYRHPVCDAVIAEYHSKAETARANGRKGGRPKAKQNKPSGFQSGSNQDAISNQDESGLKTNHKPLTTNHNIKPSCHQSADDGGVQAIKSSERIPFQQIADVYNEVCGSHLPQCLKLTDKRKAAIRKVWNLDVQGEKVFQDLAAWGDYFRECLKNPHWIGRNDRGWRADIEFLCRESTVLKLLESIV